jgi:hypothetical protein
LYADVLMELKEQPSPMRMGAPICFTLGLHSRAVHQQHKLCSNMREHDCSRRRRVALLPERMMIVSRMRNQVQLDISSLFQPL